MSEINAYYIQTVLQSQKNVTVPWIQHTFSLTYSDAKKFLAVLMRRGWVAREAQADGYAVQHEYLRLRKLQRNEVTSLIKRMGDDEAEVLKVLRSNPCSGADYAQISEEIRRRFACRAALGNLQDAKLIYGVEDVYFSCVSSATICVLEEVARVKSHVETMSSEERKEVQKAVRKLFEDLF